MPFPRYRKWTFGSLRVKIGVLKADVDIQRQAIDSIFYAYSSVGLILAVLAARPAARYRGAAPAISEKCWTLRNM